MEDAWIDKVVGVDFEVSEIGVETIGWIPGRDKSRPYAHSLLFIIPGVFCESSLSSQHLFAGFRDERERGQAPMLCRYCNAPLDPRFIEKYGAPCPHCGAPSPLIGGTMGNNGTTTHPPPKNKPTSLLPVPYQPGPGIATQQLARDISLRDTAMLQAAGYRLSTLAPVAPGLAETGEPIHISPMYTKPRAIIPVYRIISGLLSFVVVATLLCSGAVYYAKASGKFAYVQQVLGVAQPPNLPATPHTLLNPQLNPDYGPAKNIISSASTASKVDLKTGIALQPGNVFRTNQIIYLTYSVHAPTTGVVVLKWYTDNILFKTITTKPISPAKNGVFTTGVIQIEYTQPVEGKVELYWNDQLAITLYFVVR